MGTLLREVDESQVYFEEIAKILKVKPKVTEIENAKELDFKGGQIEFKDVHFKYEEGVGEQLFKGINFVIEKGKQTAIVGSSGFGKTTIFNLIVKNLKNIQVSAI